MSKFEPYSRRELRRRRMSWLRRNVAVVTVVVVGIALMLTIATAVVMTSVASPFGWHLLGAIHVGLVATALHLLHSAFLVQAAQQTVPDGAVIEGVRFLAGRPLVPWLRRLEGDAIAKDAARDVLDRLRRYRATAWRDA